MEDRKKNNLDEEGGYSVFDAGELDFLLSDPMIREVVEEIERETADNSADDDGADKKEDKEVE